MLAKIITAVVFYLLYWFCCFLGTGTNKRNLRGLRSYPDEVQQLVKNESSLKLYLPKEKNIWLVLFGNLLLFTVVFSVLGIALKSTLGLTDYLSAFIYFLLLGEGLAYSICSQSIYFGGRIRIVFGFRLSPKRESIKTRKSTLVLLCEEYRYLPLLRLSRQGS